MFLLYTLIHVFFYFFVIMNLNAEFCVVVVVWLSNIWLCFTMNVWHVNMYFEMWEFSLLMLGSWCLYYVCVFKTRLSVRTNIWYVMFNVWCLCIYNVVCDVHYLMCICDCVWEWLLFGLYLHSCPFTMNVDDMFEMYFDQVVCFYSIHWFMCFSISLWSWI